MSVTIAINGFGRIGRMVFRNAINDKDIQVVAINASYSAETLAHLIKYDTIHGKFDGEVIVETNALIVNGKKIKLINDRNPVALPWRLLDVDIVVEATGRFNEREKAALHLQAGAKKVVLTAPGKGEDVTIVMGVNEEELDIHKHDIISNASCTTNCLGPVVKVIDVFFASEKCRKLQRKIHRLAAHHFIQITSGGFIEESAFFSR